MTDQVSRLTVVAEDNVSAAMNAASAALDKVATSADTVEVSVTRVGRSADSFAKQYDAVSKASAALAKALADQAASTAVFNEALANGSDRGADFARANAALADKVAAARAKLVEAKATTTDLTGANSAATQSLGAVGDAHSKAAGSATGLSLANASVTRELIVMGHEVLTGNYTRLGGSMMVLAEHTGNLGGIISTATGFLTSMAGILTGVAAVAAITFGIMIEKSNASLGLLAETQVALRGTQDGYDALGKTVLDVAKNVSSTSGLGFNEALKAAQTLASAKYFSGTAKDLEALTRDAENLGVIMGGTETAAKALATGMQDPSKEADTLSATFSRTLTPALLEQISLTQKAGDYNKAYTLLLGGLRSAAGDAARDGLSPIARAWLDLGIAFTGSTEGWKPFMSWLATSAANVINTITQQVKELRDMWKSLGSTMSSMTSSGPIIDTSTGKATSGITLPNGVSNDIYRVAEQNNISAAIADLATKIVGLGEHSPGQFDSQGRVLTSPRGAQGLMQMMPATAAGSDINPGGLLDPTKPDDNILLGLRYLSVLGQKYNGNEQDIAGAFNAGPGRMDQVLAGKTSLPDETAKYVKNVTGSDFTGGGATIGAGTATETTVSNQKAMNDELAKTVEASRQYKDLQLGAEYSNIQEQLTKEAAAHGTDTAAYAALTQAAEKNTAERYANVDAMTAAQRASDSSLRASAGMTAAEQSLASAIEARSQVAKTAGTAFTSADQAQAVNNVLAQQSQAYARTTFAMSTAAAEQGEMVTAYGKGNQAVLDTTAKQQAYSEALKQFPRDSRQFGDAFKELIGYYQQAALEAALAKTAQMNLQSKDTLDYIQAETDSLGGNEAARTRMLATMQAEQEMHRQFGDVLPAEAQKYVALKGATADATAEFQHQQTTLQEVSGFFGTTFDTISNAITQAFATGQLQALKFGDVMKSVVSAIIAEFAKLAVLNPLKNMLFGGKDTTIDDVGGLLDKLFGSGGISLTGSSSGSTGSATLAGGFDSAGTTFAAAGAGASQIGFGTVSSGASLVENLFGGGSGAGGGIIAGIADKITSVVTSALGNSTEAINIAADAGNLSNSGIIAASLSNAAGLSTDTASAISSAAGTVADALPYIGAAISVVTSLISGDYKSAAITASGALLGAAIGSAIGTPGIGTAVGAAIGALVSAILPSHPLHPYSNVDLNVQGGQLTTANGYDVGQLTDLNADKAGVQSYADSINTYLKAVGVVITDADGTLGHIGSGITGFNRAGLTTGQTTDPSTLFKSLSFGGDPNDKSTFGIAKGALTGMSFNSPVDLQTELYKIAGFADAVDVLGISLKSVGKDISAIQIASVSGANPGATSTVKDASGNPVTYRSDLRTALNADLPGQTFADTTALDAEMQKVSDFITGTLPSLLTPTKTTSSSLQDQIRVLNGQYAAAMAQSKSYGLDNDKVLMDAENQAIAILAKPAVDAVTATMAGINARYATAVSGTSSVGPANAAVLAATQNTERTALEDQWRQVWGDTIVTNQAYIQSMNQLIATQNAEAQAAAQQATLTQETAAQGLATSALDYAKRAGYSTNDAALAEQDAKAQVERDTFIKSWTDYYGQAVTSTVAFQNQLSIVDQAHYKERLALQATFVGQYSVADRNAAGQAVTSLTTYAKGLQTSAASPLSTQSQYALAGQQFNAVSGAAMAGDYTSIQNLQTYADTFLNASRAINGSGAAYTADFTRVLDALNSVGSQSADTLTASYQASLVQGQTDQLVAELQALRAEVAALRAETQQASAAPARIAA